jgi:hypothetical protein
MLEGMRSPMLVHSVEKYSMCGDRVITADMRADAREYEDGYDWHVDAEKYEGLYPAEIFTGSHTIGQSQRVMARYGADMYQHLAISRRPVAAIVGNMTRFGLGLMAVHIIPVLGGLGGMGGERHPTSWGIAHYVARWRIMRHFHWMLTRLSWPEHCWMNGHHWGI